ncbi:putative ATP-dependent helicase IRC3 [Mucor circinelloides]
MSELRDYQARCIDITVNSLKKGVYRQLMCLPTGSGKTIIFANLISMIPSPNPQATKVLVLAHRVELIEQARDQILRYNPDLIVDVEQGCQESLSSNPDVVIASIPSLNSTDRQGSKGNRLKKLNPNEFKAIIVDEAHHGVSKTYMSIFEYFGVLKRNSTTLLWGCTATPARKDKQSLTPIFGPVLYSVNMMELINNGFLSDLQIVTAKTNEKLEAEAYYKLVVDKWKQFALPQNRRSTLAFVKKVEDIPVLCQTFIHAGFESIDYITQSTEQAKREMVIYDFKNGALSILVNCEILTEGVDLPQVDCILLTRKTKSPSFLYQMIGRGSRLHPGKSDCLVIDYQANFDRLIHGIFEHGEDSEILRESWLSKRQLSLWTAGKELGKEHYDENDVEVVQYSSIQEMVLRESIANQRVKRDANDARNHMFTAVTSLYDIINECIEALSNIRLQ